MAESTLTMAYEALRRFSAQRLGYGPGVDLAWTANQSALIQDTLDSAIRQVYIPPPLPGENVPHVWRHIKPVAEIVVSNLLSSTLAEAPSLANDETTINVAPGRGTFQPEMAIGPGNPFIADLIQFVTSGKEYLIKTRVSFEKAIVHGDATGETGTFRVKRKGIIQSALAILGGEPGTFALLGQDPSLDFWKHYMRAAGGVFPTSVWDVEFQMDLAIPRTKWPIFEIRLDGHEAQSATLLTDDLPAIPQSWDVNGHEFFVYSPEIAVVSSVLSTSASTVVLTTSILSDSNVGEELTIDSVAYVIEAVVSGTQCQVVGDARSNVAGAAVSIARPSTLKADYDLPDDYGGLSGPVTMVGKRPTFGPIPLTSEGTIRQLRQSVTERTGRPRQIAIVPRPFDPMVGVRMSMMVYPKPDGTYTLAIPYHAIPDALGSTQRYARLGMEHTELIKQSILQVVEGIEEESQGVQHARFMQALTASVFADRLRTEPDSLGIMTDRSRRGRFGDRVIHPGLTVTYRGPVTP